METEKYLVQIRFPNGETTCKMESAMQITDRYARKELMNTEIEAYDISVFGEVTRLLHEYPELPKTTVHAWRSEMSGEVIFEGESPNY